MTIGVCIAGVTGWTGRCLAPAVLDSSTFSLVGAVARKTTGQDVGEVLGREPVGVSIASSVPDALNDETDVLIDYTHPSVVKENVLAAIEHGAAVVIGTSGMTNADYEEIDTKARRKGVGVIAAGNFSITAALAKHLAGIAARHIPHWEIIDYAQADKPDSPSATTRELAEHLATIAQTQVIYPVDKTLGPRESRGVTIGGAQVHSLRLPSYVLSFEVHFGLPNERLTIRHDAGSGAEPYVAGTLRAAEKAVECRGLIRGIDGLLFDV
jgi:4-hydroxy-tetrahydrodipicolinate reductase